MTCPETKSPFFLSRKFPGSAMARTNPVVVPVLPKELLQHIYSVLLQGAAPDDDGAFLSCLKARVQALAVCTTWKSYLDPKLWPIEELHVDASAKKGIGFRILRWIASTQPAVRSLTMNRFQAPPLLSTLTSIAHSTVLVELSIFADAQVLHECLSAVSSFPRLKALCLRCSDYYVVGGQLDLGMLQPLVALERLQCLYWEHVELKGSALLPQVSSLTFRRVQSLAIHAALPQLKQLSVTDADTVSIAADHMQLSRLSQLTLSDVKLAALDYLSLPGLVALHVGCQEEVAKVLPALGGLTSLTVDCPCRVPWEAVSRVLVAAPPTLRHLHLDGYRGLDWDELPHLQCMAPLTSLALSSPEVLAYLGPLTQLQQLEFPSIVLDEMTLDDVEWISGMTGLRMLRFDGWLDKEASYIWRVQLLKKVLPVGCTVSEPAWGASCHDDI